MAHESLVDAAEPTQLRLGCHGCHVTPRNDRRRPVFAIANRVREEVVRLEALRGSVRLIHGTWDFDCGPDEAVVLSIGRDAATWIQPFIEHHLELGARHVVFLDNGSEDDTLALASRHDRVTVLSTGLSFRRYEIGMRRWLMHRFGRGRWTIYCDVDELFEYPASDRLPLRGLLQYCHANGYKAVTGQMLDMFSDRPLSELAETAHESLRDTYRFYDLTDLVPTRELYWIRDGQLRTPEIVAWFGGIRKRFFGDDCLLLTKHPLVFIDDEVGVYRYDTHFVTGAPVADISTVLLHYKYVANLGSRARRSVSEGWHKESGSIYKGIATVMGEQPDLCLKLESARELHDVQELVDAGFLHVSDRYLKWVEEWVG